MDSINQSRDGAEAYHRVCREIQSEHFKFMMSSISDVKKGWKILDLGCGTGYDTVSLSTMVGQQGEVYGIDPIRERIEVARQCYKNENLKFHVLFGKDVSSTFGKEFFDLVVSNQVIQWIPSGNEKEQTFQSLAESLKPGGEFVFTMGRQETNPDSNALKLVGLMPEYIKEAWPKSLFYESKDALEKLALENGFENVIVEEKEIKTALDTVQDMFTWMAASLHTFDYNTMRESLKEIEQNNDLSFMYNERGKVDMKVNMFLVKCKKAA